MIKVKTIILGPIQTNCYVVYDDVTLNAVIFDPSDDKGGKVQAFIETNNLKPVGVLITHAHFDHVSLVDELRKKYNIKSYASHEEAVFAANPMITRDFTIFTKNMKVDATIDVELVDGQVTDFGGISIKSIEVPGHSINSLCYYIEDAGIVISGDTVFYQDMGRTDFYPGPDTDLLNNIKTKLFVLPGNTRVYPGHGPSTTIEHEIGFIEKFYS